MSRILLTDLPTTPARPPAGKSAIFVRNAGVWLADDLGNEVLMYQPPVVGVAAPTRHAVGQIMGTGVGVAPAPIAVPIILPIAFPALPLLLGALPPAPQGQMIGSVIQNCTTALEAIRLEVNFHFHELNNGRESLFFLVYRNGILIDLKVKAIGRVGVDDFFWYSGTDNPPATGLNTYEFYVACDVVNGGSAIDVNNPANPFTVLPPVTECHAYPLGGFQ